MTHDDEYITLAQAALLCGLSPDTLRRQVQRGRLRAIRPGHDHLTTRAWLREYLASRPARWQREKPQ